MAADIIELLDQKSQVSKDHLINIDIDKDIILALDPETGEELCHFSFEAEGKLVYFRSPVLAKWPGFVRKMAYLFTVLGQSAENVLLPDDKTEFYNDPDSNKFFSAISAKLISSRRFVQKLIIEIFFNYLNGKIEGIKENKYLRKKAPLIKWFYHNVQIADIQKIFSACLSVDELVKKNANFVTTKTLQKSAEQNGELISEQRQGSQSSESMDSQSFTYEPL